jgi:NADH-quinone oxidoreductase subunit A
MAPRGERKVIVVGSRATRPGFPVSRRDNYNRAGTHWQNRFVFVTIRPMHGLPIFLFAAIALFVALSILIVAQVVGPKRRGAVKEMPYESGMDPVHSARRRFNINFYLLAIEFLVFDVELLFLYPWAVAAHEVGAFGEGHAVFFAAMGFISVLLVGFIYTWRKGVFQWN